MKTSATTLFFGILLFTAKLTQAQIPANYYDGTDGLEGQELKLRLHNIIKNHTVRSYSEFRDTILPDLDEDPNNSDNIIAFYKNSSIPKSDFANGNDGWNREHTWPSSHGFPDTSDTTYTDAHNLRPSDASVNTSKSNKDFDDLPNTAENEQGEAPDTYTDNDFWEPRDEIKGDVARILFYMSTRYESSRLDLEIVNRATQSVPEIGVLFTLIQWHEQDPVDDAERTRHEGVYGYQGNRNPFVDHPEFVAAIWGSATGPNLVEDLDNFNTDFGAVSIGSSIEQSYSLEAYNLESDVSVKVALPFSVSTDGMNWTDSIGYENDNSGFQEFTVNVRFEPTNADQTFSEELINYTDGDTLRLNLTGSEGAADLISIMEARQKALGESVLVTGIVIDAGNNSSNNRVIYDGTAGIVVRSFDAGNESENLVQGDSVTISGSLGDFANLLQISESPIIIDVIEQGIDLPEPQLVSIGAVGEEHESELITIENVQFEESGEFAGGGSSGNFTITDGFNDLVFRIGSSGHPLVGSEIPEGIYNVTGFVGQFEDDYQISPRTADDLEFVSDGSETPDLTSIANARSVSLGERVQVAGIVIGGENNSADNRVIYDGTAGIVVRSFDLNNESADLTLGDSVVVIGGLAEFNGNLQIELSPITIELKAQGKASPESQVISISEINEEVESELVTINGVSFDDTGSFDRGNYSITDGTSEATLRIGLSDHPVVGESIPSGQVSITGYIAQSQDEYQLFIRDEIDIELVEDALSIEVRSFNAKIYPNPVSGQFQMDLPQGWEGDMVKVLSLEGKELRSFKVSDVYSVESLPSGLYILLVMHDGVGYYDKLIKR